MKNKVLLLVLSLLIVTPILYAQAPGGVTNGLTAWFKADAGITNAGTNVTTWTNQATNANLTNLTPVGGNTTQTTTVPLPFNFNTYLQYNAGGMVKVPSTTATDVLALDKGSMIAVGTAPDQLIVLTSEFTSSPCGANRCCSGTRGTNSQFSNSATTFSPNAILNTGSRANIWGFRASNTGTPQAENTFNGVNATGLASTRSTGSYRFAIGSFPGYYYGQNRAAEAICYNRQLTADEFVKLQSYLAIKFGITLGIPTAPVDYKSAAGTIIWTGDAIYQNNITGIGRDDSSALLQKQSRAVTTGSFITLYNDDIAGVFPAMNADNTSNFGADNSFVIAGDNKMDTALTVCADGGKVIRMNRIWKMQATGTTGTVSVAVDDALAPPDVQTLLVSTDPTFPENATTIIPLIPTQNKYAVMNAANTYFTFGSAALDVNVSVVDVTCQQTSGGSMTANVTGGIPPYTYSWNTTPPSSANPINNIPSGNYIITITHGNGCAYTQDVTLSNTTVELNSNLTKTDALCFGDDNGTILANVTNGTAPYSFSLNNSSNYSTNNSFQNLSKGFYTVYLKDANGCVGQDTITINEPPYLTVKMDEIVDDYCEKGDEPNGKATMKVEGGTPPYAAKLNGTSVSQTQNQVQGLPEGHYTYKITDANGCVAEDTFSIAHIACCKIFLPNSFSPNGDGINDLFKAEFTGPIKLDKMYIFNRYGQAVYKAFSWGKGWDGTLHGKQADAGVYYFYIQYTCSSFGTPKTEFQKGEITLIR